MLSVSRRVMFCVCVSFLAGTVTLRFPEFVEAKSGMPGPDGTPGHYDDWFAALGISDDNSKKVLQPLLTLIQKDVIDAEANPTPLRATLKEKWALTFGGPNHRVLFHWGFNQDIKQYRPLLMEIDKQFEKNRAFLEDKYGVEDTDYMARQKEAVLECIGSERNRRNRLIISETAERTGLSGGQPPRGLSTILWDIHILGDYTTTALGGLLDLKTLRKDLINDGLDRMNFDRADLGDLCNALYDAEDKNKDPAQWPEGANQMLEALQKYFPPLLAKRWGNTFGKKGITITCGSNGRAQPQ